jgi:hypothetical protein
METIDAEVRNLLPDISMLISIALIAVESARLLKCRAVGRWKEIDSVICHIYEASDLVALSAGFNVNYYYQSIDCRYEYNVNECVSNTVSFNKNNIWVCEINENGIPLKEQEKFWNSWKAGSVINVYIDPKYS